MKILTDGIIPLYNGTCPKCNTRFEYTENDFEESSIGWVFSDSKSKVLCPKPECNNLVEHNEQLRVN